MKNFVELISLAAQKCPSYPRRLATILHQPARPPYIVNFGFNELEASVHGALLAHGRHLLPRRKIREHERTAYIFAKYLARIFADLRFLKLQRITSAYPSSLGIGVNQEGL